MRNFTKTEVNLCKKTAEKEMKDIKKGDWILLQDVLCIVVSSNENEIGYIEYAHDELIQYLILIRTKKNKEKFVQTQSKKWFPLWQEHDCLEWLLERGFYIERLGQDDECLWSLEIYELDDMGIIKGTRSTFEGESKLEPCQRAVLAVMEKKEE